MKNSKVMQKIVPIILAGGTGSRLWPLSRSSFPKQFLDSISNKIINNVKGINRVVYDITSKPPSTIELE